MTGLDAAAGHPHGEAARMMVAAVIRRAKGCPGSRPCGRIRRPRRRACRRACRAASGPGSARRRAGRCRRHCGGKLARQAFVLVPAHVIELDEAHAALGQAARQQAVGGVGAGLARIGAVEVEGGCRFLREVGQLRARRSASGRPFRTGAMRVSISGSPNCSSVDLVQLAEVVEHRAARGRRRCPAGFER